MAFYYYSGCTLKTTASNFEKCAVKVCEALEIEFKEIPNWNCCGTVYSLVTDDLMHSVAAARNLARASEAGIDEIIVLCAMCYNTLVRTNLIFKHDIEKSQKLNAFMDDEKDYDGKIKITHFLQFMHSNLKKVRTAVQKTLPLRVAPYYGCLLLKPAEIAIDDVESPSILGKVLKEIGCEVIETPYITECCGSYNCVVSPQIVSERVNLILKNLKVYGADMVVVSCPLCAFNLDFLQSENIQMPVVYFTQLLAVALGYDIKACGFELHKINPALMLQKL